MRRSTPRSGLGAKNNLTVEQPGFTLGGPIFKNKLFWFVSAEFLRQSSINTNALTAPANAALIGTAKGTGAGCTSPGLKTGAANPGNCQLSLVDACNDLLAQSPPQTINLVSGQMAGFPISGGVVTSCTPQAASSSVENLFPATATSVLNPNPATSTPSNNGLAKVDYSPNDRHHFDAFYFISREATTTVGNFQPYWGSSGVGSTNEYAGAWTWTPNSNWVNELRGGAAPNTGNPACRRSGCNSFTAVRA